MDIFGLCKDFSFEGEFSHYEVITTGNINTTYKVYMKRGDFEDRYLLQKINKNVFSNPDRIMENITNVNNFIDHRHKCENLFVLHFINSKNGLPYVIDEFGNFWRACKFFDCACFDSPEDLFVIEEAGRAFGQFQFLLNGYDASRLNVTIPDFHDTRKRIQALEKTITDAVSILK